MTTGAQQVRSPPTAASAPQEASMDTVTQAEEGPLSNAAIGEKQLAAPTNVTVPSAESLVAIPNAVSAAPVAASLDVQVQEKPVTFLNPLESVFGPPSAPSAQLESLVNGGKAKLGELKKKATKKGKGNAVLLPTSAPAAGTENIAPSCNGLKCVTASKSAKNLFYIKYLKTNPMITPAAFEEM